MKTILIFMLIVTLAMAACQPSNKIEIGPTITEDLFAGLSDTSRSTNLEIALGWGDLRLEPGVSGNTLLKGTATYNVKLLKPKGSTGNNLIRIEQGLLDNTLDPKIIERIENTWDLKLGSAPITLTVEIGAAQATLNRLADLNTAQITLKGDTGDFVLDFSGDLQRDMRVIVNTNSTQGIIIVPAGTAAEVRLANELTSVTPLDDWQQSNNSYILTGDGPKIQFDIALGTGLLELRNP